MLAIHRCEPHVKVRSVQLAPERERTPASIAAETLAGIGIEELHMVVGTFGAWRLYQDQPVTADAEVAIAEVADQCRKVSYG